MVLTSSLQGLSTFDRLKFVTFQTKDLINGYIKDCQDQLFGDIAIDNPYYNIPQPVNNHIMLFNGIFTWYRSKYGKGLKLVSNTAVTVQEMDEDEFSAKTCMFANVISKELCNKFSITFKIEHPDKSREVDVHIGHTKESSLEESIKDWNQPLGYFNNMMTTCKWNIYSDGVYFSGEDTYFKKVREIKYTNGDLFKVIFNFEGMQVAIHHKEDEVDLRELCVTKLWIGCSIFCPGDKVEMIEYKFMCSIDCQLDEIKN